MNAVDFNAEAQRRRVRGELPKGWNVKPLRAFLRPVNVRNRQNAQLLSVTRESGVIVRNVASKEENHNFIPEDLSNYKFVTRGQFVINKMKSWQGSYGVSPCDGLVSPAYFVYDLDFPCKEFFNLAIRSKVYVPCFQRFSKGIRVDQWDLMPEALKLIQFAFPPLPEQEAIVKYLDEATGRIDKAIEAEEKMVALLQERREIVINEAVGGGQDFNAETQRRGVRRELPKGWEVRRLRHCFAKMFSGLWGTDPSSDNSGIVCFRVADFDYARGGVSGDKLTYRAYRNCEVASRLVEKGDLLLEKSGGGDNSPVGRVVITDNEFTATCSNFIQALHCKVGYCSKYLCYVFRSLYSKRVNGYYYNQTTGIQNLKVAEYLSVEVPIPPLPEQEAIVKRLDEETGKIGRGIAVKRRQIDLLRERREIIINEVVTGKVKVA